MFNAWKNAVRSTKPFEIPSHRLDRFFPPDSVGSSATWMDVEGASKEVLTGAEGLLHKVVVMFVEVEGREVWKAQWLSEDVSRFLDQHGLTAIGRDFQSSRQNNVVYLRRSALADERLVALRAKLPRRARL